jgi:GH15 family glucan-1,4-alpha-glucosidase
VLTRSPPLVEELVASKIEDYGLLGNGQTAALVGRDGSIDWLCLPRFDSPSCFAALLGRPEHGRWVIAPRDRARATRRQYREDTLVLETEFETDAGTVRLTDFMPRWPDGRDAGRNELIRIVEGVTGCVRMHLEWVVRFDYGSVVPWVRRSHGGLVATAGADSLILYSPVETNGRGLTTVAEFDVQEGQALSFTMAHFQSHRSPPPPIEARVAVARTVAHWRSWAARCTYRGPYSGPVRRSMLTLKALAHEPSGGIVAAPTTSLPERLGGDLNWDYRYCWLRDATFTLYALLQGGYEMEARAWRDWLLRAVAGRPQDMQTLYGVCGERRLTEWQISWLPGYESSAPVRAGNAASTQLQLDIYGELMDTLHLARGEQGDDGAHAWAVQRVLLDFLESNWRRPDHGIWEIRGDPKQLTHSKVMCWVAFDRAVRAVEDCALDGPVDRWRGARAEIRREVCDHAYDRVRNTFVQSYGSTRLDASLLLMSLVGFLPASDPRMQGTVAAIERELLVDGMVRRYLPPPDPHGLAGGEGAFLPCSFWLADNYVLQGRHHEAESLFERLLGLRNDVGLMPEEYDPVARRFLGNFPQAFTHVGLVNTARNLSADVRPGEHRAQIRRVRSSVNHTRSRHRR